MPPKTTAATAAIARSLMNAPVKLQQHNAMHDSANRPRNPCEPDAGERSSVNT
ncbi:MAG: hypothetical protein U9N12_00570 [Euryarchaeota archaeon]|nr:hypothetical protein [Euryarchaeota archaeon]